MMRDVAVVLPFTPEAAREARAIVREQGRDLPVEVTEDAELLVSEVVSNSVRHGAPDIRLEVAVTSASVTVRVTDGGDGVPRIGDTDSRPDEASGRGLRMVQLLAVDWGVEPWRGGSGKTVWFTVADAIAPPPGVRETVGEADADSQQGTVDAVDEMEGGTRWS